MKNKFLLPIIVLMMAALACNLGDAVNPPGDVQPPAGTPVPGATQAPAGGPNPYPVDINTGLASLDYYQMTIRYITNDGAGSSSDLVFELQRAVGQDARSTRITSSSVAPGEEPSTDVNDIFRIGNDQCTGSEEDWSWESMKPNEAEMLDIVQDMVGVNPLIENPAFVGAETVNGVATNHFFFTVSGLGVKSGAEVTINQVHYWVAVDGQYLVKYDMVTETRMAADNDIMHQEFHIDLHSINQPFTISFPQGCLDASLATPEPEG